MMNKKDKKSSVEKANSKPSGSYDCCWYDLCCSDYPSCCQTVWNPGISQPRLAHRPSIPQGKVCPGAFRKTDGFWVCLKGMHDKPRSLQVTQVHLLTPPYPSSSASFVFLFVTAMYVISRKYFPIPVFENVVYFLVGSGTQKTSKDEKKIRQNRNPSPIIPRQFTPVSFDSTMSTQTLSFLVRELLLELNGKMHFFNELTGGRFAPVV